MSKWQPIETAPKDGTVILVYPPTWNGQSCSMAKWDNCRYSAKPKPYWKRIDAADRVYMSREKPPTKWMPLPEPPEAEE